MHKLYTVVFFDNIWGFVSPRLGLIRVLELQGGHVKYTDSLRPGIFVGVAVLEKNGGMPGV